MSGSAPNLLHKRFGRWTVVERALSVKHGTGVKARWLCACDCGIKRVVKAAALRKGTSRSCGCLSRENTTKRLHIHGLTGSRAYTTWRAMVVRCTVPEAPSYKHYGGRGIKVCDRWMELLNFLEDMGWPQKGKQLERINNDGDYEPGNCRWATAKEQARNTRKNRLITHNGQTKCVSEWAEIAGITHSGLMHRIRNGWPIHEALTIPSGGSRGN